MTITESNDKIVTAVGITAPVTDTTRQSMRLPVSVFTI